MLELFYYLVEGEIKNLGKLFEEAHMYYIEWDLIKCLLLPFTSYWSVFWSIVGITLS